MIEAPPFAEEQLRAVQRKAEWLGAVLPFEVYHTGTFGLHEAALHEAAHAIVGIASGLAIFAVCVGRSALCGHDGLTVYASSEGDAPGVATTILAGPRMSGRDDLGVGDAMMFFEASMGADLPPRPLHERARAQADALIEVHRAAIEALAAEIEEHGILFFGEELYERLRPHAGGKLAFRAPTAEEQAWYDGGARHSFFALSALFHLSQPTAQRILGEEAERKAKAEEEAKRKAALPWQDVGGDFQARPFEDGAGAIVRACQGAPEYALGLATLERLGRIGAACLAQESAATGGTSS